MGLRPEFRLTANSRDITAAIRERFVSLRLTDEAGVESDTLEVTLSDHDPHRPIALPSTGAELELWLGYDGRAERMGLFVCDELELSGWPGALTLRGRAAPYEQTPSGKSDLQTQKSRSWARGTRLGDMVAKIAQEHGMKPAVAETLANVELPQFDQTEESDLALLLRVARRYDAIVKAAGGRLVFAKRGASTSVSGAELPRIEVSAQDCTSWRMMTARRESPGTVVAFWHSKGRAKRQLVSVGSGEPVKRLRHWYPSQKSAEDAARAELSRRERGEMRLSLAMPGNPRLAAETRLVLSGFRQGVEREWLVSRVTHSVGADGYSCEVDAELPQPA